MVETLSGFILSYFLWQVIQKTVHFPLKLTLLLSFGSAAILSLVFNVVKLSSYKVIVYNQRWNESWNMLEFGGWLLFSLATMFVWTSIFFIMLYNSKLQKEHEQLLRAQTLAKDAQLEMLRYQLNPHFLCNTLNAINSLIEIEAPERAQLMTVQLSKFLRYSLDHNPDTKLALAHELNALNLYLEIEKTRFGDRLTLDFDISDEARSAHVPSLLIQPIIENSMKHVIAQSEEGGTISLLARVVDKQLVLELSDTGLGGQVSKSKINRSSGRGVGLSNIDERLKVLYEKNYTFELTIKPTGGIKTTIKIPYEHLPTR